MHLLRCKKCLCSRWPFKIFPVHTFSPDCNQRQEFFRPVGLLQQNVCRYATSTLLKYCYIICKSSEEEFTIIITYLDLVPPVLCRTLGDELSPSGTIVGSVSRVAPVNNQCVQIFFQGVLPCPPWSSNPPPAIFCYPF